jgi:DNA-binding response OmpR family regulator
VRRFLIIDDEPFVREAMVRVLTSPGVVVEAAADATAGIELLRTRPADLAIIDLMLPGVDGVAAIGQIRREFPRIGIIGISGGGSHGLTEYRPDSVSTCAYLAASKSAGADAVIAKPFETQELWALIDTVLGTDKRAAQCA